MSFHKSNSTKISNLIFVTIFFISIVISKNLLAHEEKEINSNDDQDKTEYLQTIIKLMQNKWMQNQNLINLHEEELLTGITISFDKNGILQKASIIQSCGIPELDNAILQGIYEASPFPAPHCEEDLITFEFGVKHPSRLQKQANDFKAAVSRYWPY